MPDRTGGRRLPKFVIWTTLVLICFGLGYPTLNRYDPRHLLPDAATYGKLAQQGPCDIPSPFRFRVLVPYLAHSIAVLAEGQIGTWDPLLFGFRVVNFDLRGYHRVPDLCHRGTAAGEFRYSVVRLGPLPPQFCSVQWPARGACGIRRRGLYGGTGRQHVLRTLAAASVIRRVGRLDQRFVYSFFYSPGGHLVEIVTRPASQSRCNFHSVNDRLGVRGRDCVAVRNFRASGLALGFCVKSQHAYELRGELCPFVPESEFLVHCHLASSARAGANPRIPTPMADGRWAGNAVCVRTECVPQSRRRRRWRHRPLHL